MVNKRKLRMMILFLTLTIYVSQTIVLRFNDASCATVLYHKLVDKIGRT